jgi:transcription antitermination factor NusG
MLAIAGKGNLEQVRSALEGITGQVVKPAPIVRFQYYMIVSRPNHEYEMVDSFRRHHKAAYWPSFEELVTTRSKRDGQPIRRVRRIGIISGYVFTPVEPEEDLTILLMRIVSAIGVVRTHSGDPLRIEEQDIQTIRRIETSRNTPLPMPSEHSFKIGEKVRFVDDNIHRWAPGRITKIARGGRISVEVATMGRKIEIKALPHQIERV